jgi:hypothetical protein
MGGCWVVVELFYAATPTPREQKNTGADPQKLYFCFCSLFPSEQTRKTPNPIICVVEKTKQRVFF